MGQYHLIANFDKHEFIHPHNLGDGLKLMEFGMSANGTLTGLAILLAASNKGGARGGGDLHPWIADHGAWDSERTVPGDPNYADRLMEHVVGRWAGDRIGIVGDYFQPDDVPGVSSDELEDLWGENKNWINISDVVSDAIDLDYYAYTERHKEHEWPAGGTYTRADSFGMSRHEPDAILNADGTITKVIKEEDHG